MHVIEFITSGNIIKQGDTGEFVHSIQSQLHFLGYCSKYDIDRSYGRKTRNYVCIFQHANGEKPDGVVGKNTISRLYDTNAIRGYHLKLVKFDQIGDSYKYGKLRNDVADKYVEIKNIIKSCGGVLASSGTMRSLRAKVIYGRSSTSLHYLGRAIDLYLNAGMINPKKDPYIIEYNSGRKFTVFARVYRGGEIRTINACTYQNRTGGIKVIARVINLTELFSQFGFYPIKARKSYFNGGKPIGSEWWHFQNTDGLIENKTTFGDELQKIHPIRTLFNSNPWIKRKLKFGKDWS